MHSYCSGCDPKDNEDKGEDLDDANKTREAFKEDEEGLGDSEGGGDGPEGSREVDNQLRGLRELARSLEDTDKPVGAKSCRVTVGYWGCS